MRSVCSKACQCSRVLLGDFLSFSFEAEQIIARNGYAAFSRQPLGIRPPKQLIQETRM
jgi:hypothetical protein